MVEAAIRERRGHLRRDLQRCRRMLLGVDSSVAATKTASGGNQADAKQQQGRGLGNLHAVSGTRGVDARSSRCGGKRGGAVCKDARERCCGKPHEP